MKNNYNFLMGTGVALVTPFNSNGSVDYNSLEKIVDLLGKEARQKANQLLLYIYDDGTVVKKIIHK